MLNKMKNVLFILTILIFIISCRNYESKEYFDNENQAISDIRYDRIHKMKDLTMERY